MNEAGKPPYNDAIRFLYFIGIALEDQVPERSVQRTQLLLHSEYKSKREAKYDFPLVTLSGSLLHYLFAPNLSENACK
jgi:hypothetical protein